MAEDGGDGDLRMDTDTEGIVTLLAPPGSSSRCPSRPRSPRRPPPSPRCPAQSAAGRPAGPAAANIFRRFSNIFWLLDQDLLAGGVAGLLLPLEDYGPHPLHVLEDAHLHRVALQPLASWVQRWLGTVTW